MANRKAICKMCGAEFKTANIAQKYCDKCRLRREQPVIRICPACKTEFVVNTGNQRYCSEYCKKQYNTKIKGSEENVFNMRSYAYYQQSKLARCVEIARKAGMTYGEAERAGLFVDV